MSGDHGEKDECVSTFPRDFLTIDGMSPAELASRIDHTILKPEAMPADIAKVVDQSVRKKALDILAK